MKIRRIAAAAVGAMTAVAMPACAAGSMSDMNMGDMRMSAPDAALTDAEVTCIDAAHAMVTLKHGALRNVGMAPMTMTFKAGDPAMVEALHVGDKVRVRVERVNGTLAIVKLVKRP